MDVMEKSLEMHKKWEENKLGIEPGQMEKVIAKLTNQK